MLRAVSSIYIESQALVIRRDVFKVFRTAASTNAAPSSQTVLKNEAASCPAPAPPATPPPPRPPPPPRRWPVGALAAVLTASLGGVYVYRKLTINNKDEPSYIEPTPAAQKPEAGPPPAPASGSAFPAHVQYLLVGGGTAAFAAMRAIRAARPGSQVLLVSEEHALPYMRPPLSKELWREPELALRAEHPDDLTFRQWNGKRRSLVYEPAAFYTPVEKLESSATGGASVARGWKVTRLDVTRHEAELEAPGQPPVTLKYDKCLVATGSRARRVPSLRAAANAGRALTLRGLRDATRLAQALEEPHVRTVCVYGGGFLATELSAALAERLRESGRRVVQVVSETAPMAAVLPRYLAEDAARRLRAAGVDLVTDSEVVESSLTEQGVRLRMSSGTSLDCELVVECTGAECDRSLAAASGLEVHPELGGLLVNAELQARTDVYAAGDAACFYDVVLGRRRVEHHDHAVLSGRLAGENMAAAAPPKHYMHQSMFWSDLGPNLGYEAIGIIDSRLPTVGVFSADAVAEDSERLVVSQSEPEQLRADLVESSKTETELVSSGTTSAVSETDVSGASAKRYARGVVFYLREKRVVGILLWNLFNRMHVARQVLAQGEFDDLFEVAKLFSPHEED